MLSIFWFRVRLLIGARSLAILMQRQRERHPESQQRTMVETCQSTADRLSLHPMRGNHANVAMRYLELCS